MKVLGFNFRKISIEKLSDNLKGVKANTNVDISDITSAKADVFKTKEEFLAIKFKYSVNYDPNYANVELEGNILVSVESKVAREILKQWKNKSLPEDFRLSILNLVIRKSTLKALELEDELNIPLHIPMPSIKKDQIQNNK